MLYDLAFACYVYAGITNFDNTYSIFQTKINGNLEMFNESHRLALLEWLNKWGCRQFEKNFYQYASNYLKDWYEYNKYLLPSPEIDLLQFSNNDLDNAEMAYNSLLSVKACDKKNVGPTGASKILFALRKNAFPPWDEAIRDKQYDGTAKSYRKYLESTKQSLLQLNIECGKHGISLVELPSILDRNSASLVKLIDEYNWIVVTKKCPPPTIDKLVKWHNWVK